MMRTVLITFGAAGLLAGCASLGPYKDTPRRCTTSGDTLYLSGPTDADMLDCVESVGDIDRIVINSTGGDVDTALRIGERVAALDVTLEVAPGCSSSCANYILPVARDVVLAPGFLLLSHGGIDDGLVEKAVSDDPRAGALSELAEAQAAYARRHAIPPGWLFRRRTAAAYDTGLGEDVTGEPTGLADAERIRFTALEPAFIASCLPDLPVVVKRDDRAEAARSRVMASQDALPSGGMRCRPGASWDD